MKWFCYEPLDNNFDIFDTEEEALSAAKDWIEEYCAGGEYPQEIENITVGRVTHECTAINIRPAPKDSGLDYYCDYVMDSKD